MQNPLELRLRLALIHHRKIVSESTKTRLELSVVESARLVLERSFIHKKERDQSDYLVEVLEHHRELSERVFRYSRLVSSLDLLFQIVLHSHGQLVELITSLRQTDSRVLSVTDEGRH